jgi:hypothetical protein
MGGDAAGLHPAVELDEGGVVDTDVLESCVPQADVLDRIPDLEAITDSLIGSGEHEDEIHELNRRTSGHL